MSALPKNPTPEQIRQYVVDDAIARFNDMSPMQREELQQGMAMVEGQTARILGPEVWNRS